MALGTKELYGLMQTENGQREEKKQRSTQALISTKEGVTSKETVKMCPGRKSRRSQLLRESTRAGIQGLHSSFPPHFRKNIRRSEGQLEKLCNSRGVWSSQFFPPHFTLQK